MQLRLRTKLTLVMTGLVLLVVAVLSVVFVAQLVEQALLEIDKRTTDVAQQVFEQARRALTDAAESGLRPESDDPQEIHDYVRHAFEVSENLHAQLKATKSIRLIYEVSITDYDGTVLVSSDESLQGKFLARRAPISQLTQRGYLHQAKVLAGPPRRFERDLPFTKSDEPFGEVRVVVDSGLLRDEISPNLRKFATIVLLALVISTVLAAVVSGATLAPLRDISAQLDRISAGQYDAPSPEVKGFAGGADELGQVSRKITKVGQQLRGVHEIFSTLRENMDSVMAGLEDGLLLFTRDARAVMVSPAAEKFLGAPAGHFLGRRVNEIFPPGHPLREVLHVEGDELSEIAAETDLHTAGGVKRVSVSVQAIQENGERMGALVTLRDLDSLESINTQLQVSESRSRSVTSAPMRSPFSWMACTLTLTLFTPPAVWRSVSAAISLNSSPSTWSTSRNGCPGGKISFTRRPKKCPAGAPRNFSAAGLTITARASRVNSSRPSSSPAITESMFSRNVLKISCTPRSCCPTLVILRLTWPSSSAPPANPLTSGDGASY